MTSDGITKKDWDKVHSLAVKIVNASAQGEEKKSEDFTERLYEALNRLEEKYGALPSILATRADYTPGARERVRLWQAAFALAKEREDQKNQLLVASSLAEDYAERQQFKSAVKWLEVAKNLLKQNYDPDEADNLKEIARQIKRSFVLERASMKAREILLRCERVKFFS